MKTLLHIITLCLLFTSCESPLLSHIKEAELAKVVGADGLAGKGERLRINGLDLSLEMKWETGPYGDPTLESALTLNFKNQAGEFQDLPMDVEIIHYSYMPSMGHGPADEGYLVHEYEGHYLIQEIFYSMPGDWTITLEFWSEGVKLDEKVLKLYL